MLQASPGAYDLVLMDVQMPVMDGYSAARAIRADAALTHLLLVAIAANAMAVDRQAVRAAGMGAHVGKPFELEHLAAVIRHQLGRHPAPASPSLSLVPAGAPAPAAPTTRLDPQAAAQSLRELARLLAQAGMAALAALEQLRAGPGAGLDLSALGGRCSAWTSAALCNTANS